MAAVREAGETGLDGWMGARDELRDPVLSPREQQATRGRWLRSQGC